MCHFLLIPVCFINSFLLLIHKEKASGVRLSCLSDSQIEKTFPVVTVLWLRKSWKQLQQKSQFSDCNLDKNFTEQYPKVDDSLPSDFKILENYRQKYLKINEVDGTDHEEVEFFHAKSVQGEEERNLVNKDESRG